MCNTGWKKALDRCGRTQRSTAQALSVNQAELSLVMQGRAFLTPEKFDRACELLDCRPTEIYSTDVLALMYGREQEKVRKRGLRVELDADTRELVELVAADERLTKTQAANAIIRRAYETRRIEQA